MAGKYIEKVEQALDVKGLADSMDLSDIITNYNNALDTTSKSLGISPEKLEQFFKDNSINTQKEIDAWIEIAQGAKTADEAKKAYLSSGVMLSEDLKAVYDYNKALQDNKKILDGFKNGDYQRVDGNIDHFNRPAIVWTKEEIDKQRKSLEAWENSLGKDKFSVDDFEEGDVSTVLGGTDNYGENGKYYIAYTPVIDDGTGNGEVLTPETLDAYIDSVIEKATEDGKVDFDKVLEIDATGSKIQGYDKTIKNVIGGI